MAENVYIKEYLKDNSVIVELPAFAEAGESFLGHAARLRQSSSSMKIHADGLRQFLSFLVVERIERPQDVTPDDIDKFRIHLTESKLSRSTIDMRMGFVRKFFRHLAETGIIFDDPARDLVLPRGKQPLGYVPSVEDMRKLLVGPDLSTPCGVRDRAFLEVVYCCGLRIAEAVGLNVRDVNLKNQALRVFGKGAKERALPLGGAASEALRDYLEETRAFFLTAVPDAEALWLNRRGRRMTIGGVNTILNKLCSRTGIRRISVHAIRRACASHMLMNGAHPTQVRMLLGHVDERTLSRYLEVTANDIKKSHAKSGAGR